MNRRKRPSVDELVAHLNAIGEKRKQVKWRAANPRSWWNPVFLAERIHLWWQILKGTGPKPVPNDEFEKALKGYQRLWPIENLDPITRFLLRRDHARRKRVHDEYCRAARRMGKPTAEDMNTIIGGVHA